MTSKTFRAPKLPWLSSRRSLGSALRPQGKRHQWLWVCLSKWHWLKGLYFQPFFRVMGHQVKNCKMHCWMMAGKNSTKGLPMVWDFIMFFSYHAFQLIHNHKTLILLQCNYTAWLAWLWKMYIARILTTSTSWPGDLVRNKSSVQKDLRPRLNCLNCSKRFVGEMNNEFTYQNGKALSSSQTRTPRVIKNIYCISVNLYIKKSRLEMNRIEIRLCIIFSPWGLTSHRPIHIAGPEWKVLQLSAFVISSDELMGKMRPLTKLEC